MAEPLNTAVTGRDDWEVATFQIITAEGPKPITGMVRLHFGIHWEGRNRFALTHLPTGSMIGWAETEGMLVRAVGRVKGMTDWGFSDRFHQPSGAKAVADALFSMGVVRDAPHQPTAAAARGA